MPHDHPGRQSAGTGYDVSSDLLKGGLHSFVDKEYARARVAEILKVISINSLVQYEVKQ